MLSAVLPVGRRELDSRLVLAPMAGLGHVAFREVLAGFGGFGFMVTEMCNALAVPSENRHSSAVFRWRDEEAGRLVCQIFGGEPQSMARAASRIEAEGFMGVDINMGCSVAAICKRGYGAALLRDPQRAVAIVRAVRQAVGCPVMVKFRSGWGNSPDLAVDLAQRFEEAGADLLTFHPRVAPDRRSRPPRQEHIRAVVEAVSIPVLGNGDVFSAAHCSRMLCETGCAGVSIGRMAVARPWIFAELTAGFVPDQGIYLRTALAMIERIWHWFEPTRAIKLYKKYAVYLAANFVHGHSLWPELVRGHTREAMADNAWRILSRFPQVASTPNAFLFTA
ncbi:MAG: tRNA-dihydrouridine synthase family protein [Desulfovibrionales bacterium]|nr:tRNA-dihydrouridine synthase family protein [Desulfovibrionales bacterium]